jgi:hypothetical protein
MENMSSHAASAVNRNVGIVLTAFLSGETDGNGLVLPLPLYAEVVVAQAVTLFGLREESSFGIAERFHLRNYEI